MFYLLSFVLCLRFIFVIKYIIDLHISYKLFILNLKPWQNVLQDCKVPKSFGHYILMHLPNRKKSFNYLSSSQDHLERDVSIEVYYNESKFDFYFYILGLIILPDHITVKFHWKMTKTSNRYVYSVITYPNADFNKTISLKKKRIDNKEDVYLYLDNTKFELSHGRFYDLFNPIYYKLTINDLAQDFENLDFSEAFS